MNTIAKQRYPGAKLTLVDREKAIHDVEAMLERGITRPSIIADAIGVDRKTAAKYRDAVIESMPRDKAMRREETRALQIRQINYQIEQVTNILDELDRNIQRGQMINLQTYTALHNTLRGYFDSRAKITGLNWENTLNVNASAPLLIIRSNIEDINH